MKQTSRVPALRHLSAIVLLSTLPALAPAAFGAEEVLIDTDFNPGTEAAKPANLEALATPQETAPLTMPTRASAAEPSTLTIKPAQADPTEYQAVFDIQPREGTDDTSANAIARWDLQLFALQTGIYELTYEFTPRSEPKQGARVQVHLTAPDGKPIHTPETIHASEHIAAGMDTEGKYGTRGRGVATNLDWAVKVKIHIDMNAHVWTVYIDDVETIHREIPAALLEAEPHPIISQITFGSEAGLGAQAPCTYALSKVRFVRISE